MATPKTLTIFNDGEFIRVADSARSTTTYFNKKHLVVQKANTAGSFYLKNDTQTGFYVFAAVGYPNLPNMDELIRVITEWAREKSEDWELSKAEQIMSVVDPRYISSEVSTIGGTSNYVALSNASRITLSETATNIHTQTKKILKYRRGQDTLTLMNGCLVEASPAPINTMSRIGMFEDYSIVNASYPSAGSVGAFFQYSTNGTGVESIAVVMRRKGAGNTSNDTPIAQANWNIDKFDGTGPSGINLSSATVNGQTGVNVWRTQMTFAIEMKNRTGTTFKMGVLYNNRLLWCHEFVDTSGISLTKDDEPSLPLRWVLRRNVDGTAATGTMLIGTAAVYSMQDNSNDDVRTFSASLSAPVFLRTDNSVSGSTIRALMTLRLRPDFVRKSFKVTKVQLANTDQGIAQWALVYNPTRTVIGTDTFANETESIVQRTETESYVSGSFIIASGYINANCNEVIELDEEMPEIMSDPTGIPDIISLQLKVLKGTCNVTASVDWREYV